jgi:hypothetical protein
MRTARYIRWTKAQDAHVRKNWGILSAEDIGKPMGRTADAIRQRAYHLGLEGQHMNPSRSPKPNQ